MKKVLLFLAFATTVAFTDAQVRKIPSTVTDALTAKYPNAQTVSWKDKITSFEASFVNNGTTTEAYFKSTGDWIETDKELTYEALPSVVKDGFNKSKYADWKTGDVVEIQKPAGTQYRIMVKKSDLDLKYLYFDTTGALVKEAMTL